MKSVQQETHQAGEGEARVTGRFLRRKVGGEQDRAYSRLRMSRGQGRRVLPKGLLARSEVVVDWGLSYEEERETFREIMPGFAGALNDIEGKAPEEIVERVVRATTAAFRKARMWKIVSITSQEGGRQATRAALFVEDLIPRKASAGQGHGFELFCQPVLEWLKRYEERWVVPKQRFPDKEMISLAATSNSDWKPDLAATQAVGEAYRAVTVDRGSMGFLNTLWHAQRALIYAGEWERLGQLFSLIATSGRIKPS